MSALTSEWASPACKMGDWEVSPNVVTHWGDVFALKTPTCEPKYPKLTKLVKAVFSLPHGNADCKRGFSVNKCTVEHRSLLSISSITSLGQTKPYMKCYSVDATKARLTKDLRSVGTPYKANRERIGNEEAWSSLKCKRKDAGGWC